MKIQTFFIAALVSIFLLSGQIIAWAEPAGQLIEFEIKDGDGQKRRDTEYHGTSLLALWGDRGGSEFMKLWSPALSDSLSAVVEAGQLRRLDIAHTKGAPFFIKGKIKKRFRETWEEVVLLDWDADFLKAYECVSDSCTVLLFDEEGDLTHRWTVGEPEPAQIRIIEEAARRTASP